MILTMNKKNKILSILIVILFIGTSVPIFSGKTYIKDNSNLINNKNLSFDIKIKLAMRLAHMQSISACVIKNNTIVWSNNYGFSNRLLLQRPTIKTDYKAASISKVVTATAIMQLYEKGYFDLDDNVSEYLSFELKNPKYPNENITFRMLLSHQSSLNDNTRIKSYLLYLFSNKQYSFLKEILLPNGSNYDPDYWADYPPGADAYYSNFGFILLGYIIEQITKKPYEQYVEENIFKPLEMNITGFNLTKVEKNNLAVPYIWFAGFYFRIPKTDSTFINPCGGMYTTVEDLSHLLIAHLNGGVYNNKRILENSTVELMHKIQYPNSTLFYDMRFGLGWLIWPDENNQPLYQGHDGGLKCYGSVMRSRTSDNTSIIYFYNSQIFPRKPFQFMSLILAKIGSQQVIRLLFQTADEL